MAARAHIASSQYVFWLTLIPEAMVVGGRTRAKLRESDIVLATLTLEVG